jgi:hypothetical protein
MLQIPHSTAPDKALTDLAAKIRVELAAATEAVKRTVMHALAAGDLLLEAKAQLKHGQWLPWLRDHCGIAERTARLYMQLARSRVELESKSATIADLTLNQAASLLAPPDSMASRSASVAVSVKSESKSAPVTKRTSVPVGWNTFDPKKIAAQLNSLSWVEAPLDLRVRFVDAVGPINLFDAMTEQQQVALVDYIDKKHR